MDHWKQIIIIGTEGTNKKQCKIGHRSIWSPQGVQRENVTLLIRLLHIRISPSGISTRRLIQMIDIGAPCGLLYPSSIQPGHIDIDTDTDSDTERRARTISIQLYPYKYIVRRRGRILPEPAPLETQETQHTKKKKKESRNMAFSPRCSVTKKQRGYFHTKTNDETNDKTNDIQNWQKHTRTKNTYILHIVANMLTHSEIDKGCKITERIWQRKRHCSHHIIIILNSFPTES